jgi:hypothetical protein
MPCMTGAPNLALSSWFDVGLLFPSRLDIVPPLQILLTFDVPITTEQIVARGAMTRV